MSHKILPVRRWHSGRELTYTNSDETFMANIPIAIGRQIPKTKINT
jgi:hypothetical protein